MGQDGARSANIAGTTVNLSAASATYLSFSFTESPRPVLDAFKPFPQLILFISSHLIKTMRKYGFDIPLLSPETRVFPLDTGRSSILSS